MDELFPFLYELDQQEAQLFGEFLVVPVGTVLKYGKDVLVARFPKSGGDGQSVEIDICAMPARFYRLRALEDKDSIGGKRKAFTLSTGSGQDIAKLMVQLAKAITQGMVGINNGTDDPS